MLCISLNKFAAKVASLLVGSAHSKDFLPKVKSESKL
jgi:hypothetical protein